MEEDIIFGLLQKVVPSHQLRAAFMRDSIRGWVYLEATMNKGLRHLLRRMPGIFLRDSDIIDQHIELKDWIPLLTMEGSKELPKVGDWVEVRKGIYKGDVGYVKSVESWGVQLLLVPRISSPEPSYTTHSKRKRTCPRATPALFDPVAFKQSFNMEVKHIHGELYSFRGNQFEHGLLLKPSNFSSTSTVHHIPLSLMSLFRDSLHPQVNALETTFPRPLEWQFSEGEQVYILPRIGDWRGAWKEWQQGIITSVLADNLQVDLSNNKGIVNASWSDIRKKINVGDYVEITGGVHRGKFGWFNAQSGWFIQGDNAPVVEDATVIQLVNSEKDIENRMTVGLKAMNLSW